MKKELNSEVLSRRILNLLTNLYTTPHDSFYVGSSLKFDTFIHSKRDSEGNDIYKVSNLSYIKVRHYIFKKIISMFNKESDLYLKYTDVNDKDTEFRVKIAYLIESFMLGSYEIAGGQLPQIFIKIKDPYKLKLLSQQKDYSNNILQDVKSRQKHSVKIMEKFFTTQMDNSTRWDFIENYFLGKNLGENF